VGQLGGSAGVDRIIDSIQVFGRRPPRTESAQVTWLELDQPGAVLRWTGAELAPSPMLELWPALAEQNRLSEPAGTMKA
jgi:hypothetical protein